MRVLGSYFAALSIVLTACQSPISGPGRVAGFIDGDSHLQVIVAPSAVAIRQTFDVTVSTFGNFFCTSDAGADVSIDGLTARITPYDIHRDGTCPSRGGFFPRTVQVRFDHPGAATIRVHGRSLHSKQDITVDHTVLVGQ